MSDVVKKVVVFSGHRDVRYKHDLAIQRDVNEVCEWADEFIVGGAKGADTIALLAICDRSERGKRIPLTRVVVPGWFGDQPEEARAAISRAILWASAELVEMKCAVNAVSLKERNFHMLDMAKQPAEGMLLAYFRQIYQSGTWSAMSYAKRNNIPIKEIAL